MAEKIKILFLAASPDDAGRIRSDIEAREIEKRLREAKHGNAFELIKMFAVQPEDILTALREQKPHIVHFSGHGSRAGKIVLENVLGGGQPVKIYALAGLLRTLKGNVKMVVLNACYTIKGAEEISKVADFTIGTSKAILDDAAIAFSSAFYQTLAGGESVSVAFEAAKALIPLKGIKGQEVPVLLVREGADASKPFVADKYSEGSEKSGTAGTERTNTTRGNVEGSVIVQGARDVTINQAPNRPAGEEFPNRVPSLENHRFAEKRRRWPYLLKLVPLIVAILSITAAYWQYVYKPSASEYSGRVIDAVTQRGISHAMVSVESQGVPQVYYTDSEGVFHFKPGEANLGVQLRVEATGYQIYDRNVSLSRTSVERIPLTSVSPRPTPSVSPTSVVLPSSDPKPTLIPTRTPSPTLTPTSTNECPSWSDIQTFLETQYGGKTIKIERHSGNPTPANDCEQEIKVTVGFAGQPNSSPPDIGTYQLVNGRPAWTHVHH